MAPQETHGLKKEGNLIWEFIYFCFGYYYFFFPPLLVASVASVAPGGSWWLLRLLVAPGGFYGSWLRELLAPMAHLSSIDQSISEACSPGACCALDTP